MDIIDTFTSIADDFLPSIFNLTDDFRDLVTENNYERITKILLIIKLVVYGFIFVRMFYFLYFRGKTRYTSSVSLKLVITFINILVLIFILSNMKDKLIEKYSKKERQ